MTGQSILTRRSMWRWNERVRVGAGFFALVIVSLVVAPVRVTLSVLAAAAMHEAGHLAAMRAFGVRCERVKLGAFGAELHAPGLERLSYGRELVVTLAGVGVNLVCAAVLGAWGGEEATLHAGAHATLLLFNLLPVPPLDGARALELAASYFLGPGAGSFVAAAVGMGGAAVAAAFALRLALAGQGWLFVLAAAGLVRSAVLQIGLAKPRASV